MNPMLQRHCAKFIYIVPDGLRELMSDISREVIRMQPEQIYTYIADYLDALMITRENARVASKMVDNISEIAETTVDILLRIGLSRAEADAIVTVIQNALKDYIDRQKPRKSAFSHIYEESEAGEGFNEEEAFTQQILNQLNVSKDQLQHIVIIIQTAWRKFKERQRREKQLLFGMVDWRIAAKSAIMLYRKTGVTKYEANRAATLIKAAYKGYYTRRIMRRLLHMGLEASEPQTTEEASSEQLGETTMAIASYMEGFADEEESKMEYIPMEILPDSERHVPHDHLHPVEHEDLHPVEHEHPQPVEHERLHELVGEGMEEHDYVQPGEIAQEEHLTVGAEDSAENAPPPNTENMTSGAEPDGPSTEVDDLPADEPAEPPGETVEPGSDLDTDTENARETTTDYTTDETEDEA